MEEIIIKGFITRVGPRGENSQPLFDHPLNEQREFSAIRIQTGKQIKVTRDPTVPETPYTNVVKSVDKFELDGQNHYFVSTNSSFHIVKEKNQ